MSSQPTTCPACGSSDLETTESVTSVQATFGPVVSATLEKHRCRACGFEGDFGSHNDERIQDALERSERSSIDLIISDLNDMKISMAYVERALGLPMRTISRWKSGEHSAAGVAVLRIVRAFPWVLSAAEARFEATACASLVVSQAANVLISAAKEHRVNWTITTLQQNHSLDLNLHLDKPQLIAGPSNLARASQ